MTVLVSPIHLILDEILLIAVITHELTTFSLTHCTTQFYPSSGTNP